MRFPISWLVVVIAIASSSSAQPIAGGEAPEGRRKVWKSDEEWAKQLTRDQFLVCRQKATEPPFSGKYVHTKAKGVYHCVCCDAELFSSRTKFDSGTGWPSFWAPIASDSLDTAMDYHRADEVRVEVMCSTCGAHLGHVFDDGPRPTGLRYCMNSVALKFVGTSNPSPPAKKAGPASKPQRRTGRR